MRIYTFATTFSIRRITTLAEMVIEDKEFKELSKGIKEEIAMLLDDIRISISDKISEIKLGEEKEGKDGNK